MRVLWRKQVLPCAEGAAVTGGGGSGAGALPRCQGCAGISAPQPWATCGQPAWPAQQTPSLLPGHSCLQPVPLTFGPNCIFSPLYLS